jgi:hypothetical protein
MKLQSDTRAGFTLVESAFAIVLLTLFAGGSLLLVGSTRDAYRTESVTMELNETGRSTFNRIAERLRSANSDTLTPVGIAAPASTSWISYFRSLGHDGTAVIWSDPEWIGFERDPGDPDDGVDNDGDGQIDEGRVVWIQNPGAAGERRVVLCHWVPEDLEGEIPGNMIDDNGNGLEDEAGFAVDIQDGRVTVFLTVGRRDGFGHLVMHTMERTIALRNTPEAP